MISGMLECRIIVFNKLICHILNRSIASLVSNCLNTKQAICFLNELHFAHHFVVTMLKNLIYRHICLMNHQETNQTNPMTPWDSLNVLIDPSDPLKAPLDSLGPLNMPLRGIAP